MDHGPTFHHHYQCQPRLTIMLKVYLTIDLITEADINLNYHRILTAYFNKHLTLILELALGHEPSTSALISPMLHRIPEALSCPQSHNRVGS